MRNLFLVCFMFLQTVCCFAGLETAHLIYAKSFSETGPGVYVKDGVIFVIAEQLNVHTRRHAEMKCMFLSRDLLFEHLQARYVSNPKEGIGVLESEFPEFVSEIRRQRPLDFKLSFELNASQRILQNAFVEEKRYRYVTALSYSDVVKSLPEKSPNVLSDKKILGSLELVLERIEELGLDTQRLKLLDAIECAPQTLVGELVDIVMVPMPENVGAGDELEGPVRLFEGLLSLEQTSLSPEVVAFAESMKVLMGGDAVLDSCDLVFAAQVTSALVGVPAVDLLDSAIVSFKSGKNLDFIEGQLLQALAQDSSLGVGWNLLGRVYTLTDRESCAMACYVLALLTGDPPGDAYSNLADLLGTDDFQREALGCALVGHIISRSPYSEKVLLKTLGNPS